MGQILVFWKTWKNRKVFTLESPGSFISHRHPVVFKHGGAISLSPSNYRIEPWKKNLVEDLLKNLWLSNTNKVVVKDVMIYPFGIDITLGTEAVLKTRDSTVAFFAGVERIIKEAAKGHTLIEFLRPNIT